MKHKNHRHPISRIIVQTVQKQRLHAFLLAAAIIGAIAVGVTPPLVLERIVDHLAAGEPVLLSMAAGYVLLSALASLFDAAKESLITVFGQKITHEIRTEMSAKLYRLPTAYFVQNEPGTVTSRFVNDVNTLETLFASGIVSMFADVCRVVSILAVVFYKSTGLGILLTFAAPLLLLMTRIFQKRMLAAQVDNRAAVGKTNRQIPETVDNLRTIHVFHRETYMQERYDASVRESFAAIERSNFYDAVYSPIVNIISAVLVAVMLVLSVQDSVFRQFFGMSVGTVVALIAYVGKVFAPLESIGMEIQNIQSAVAGVRRIREFLQEEERCMPEEQTENGLPGGQRKRCMPDSPVDRRMADKQEECCRIGGQMQHGEIVCPAVEVQNLTFGYGEDRAILHNFSLCVQKGEMVTLTGRTGIGKSTLFKLLLGLYLPQQGQVRIFGTAADRIPDRERRKIFGYVEQNFHLIHGTIREQVTLKDETVTEEQTERALRMTGLWEVCTAQKNGLDTPCTEEMFSQGQLQLLAIARAVVLEPEILLLDEITANLDSITETQVLNTLKLALKGRTVISISHRLYEQTGGKRIELCG